MSTAGLSLAVDEPHLVVWPGKIQRVFMYDEGFESERRRRYIVPPPGAGMIFIRGTKHPGRISEGSYNSIT